ncbi:sarcolemmal membrane-associated protein isoform X2 [Plodia interpunctella]|uniref:sarcolemmal membrane-associated protein isoform X2 n=1 Tax=Plodia interpunctella TaxID=58824 RepID=UPI0023682D17|nr:sarcolemmal membrane-associated protein isoform X2 [Plodia interpunctella]
MVVKRKKVPRMNNTFKSTDYSWTPGPEPPNNQDVGVPRAHFIPHSNSLPFEERRVTLEQPVKIGRNVYRATPSPTNTIFECRVLSRHHATLYYDKGHFYLVDNRSSNGTFINNNRCSISKQQEPHEVFSGDVVQFGIPVVENADNLEKNTFPPVVALLKLYHPDGKEAKLSFNPTMTTPLHLKELYQLNNFVQDAIQREASLETRLRTLRECVERTRAEAEASWELFVGEQRLLLRVHALESMLAVGKQPDVQQVAQLLNDKRNYQEVAQESLRVAHEQRLALEETLERRNREAAALHQHNCTLRLTATNATAELQKLAARCERKMCAARLAIAAAEERELAARTQLPLTYSVQNGEAKMLVLSTDSNKMQEAKRSGSLEDAVRALPDYIKLLLPQHLLNKVGIKAISAEGNTAKEFELILKKNNMYNAETKEKEEDEGVVGGSDEEKSVEPDSCTDDEKQSRLNHDPEHEDSPNSLGELRADNNANSEIYDEQEDSPSKAGVEYANVLRVMAGLNEEIKTLRARLTAACAENSQLRGVRDELLAVGAEPQSEEEYRANIQQLQTQLTVAEETNQAEIQRLLSQTADLQSQLAFRPTRAEVDDLTACVAQLRDQLREKQQLIDQLQPSQPYKETAEKAVETSDSFEDIEKVIELDEAIDTKKINAEIDEMFQLGYEDEDEDTDSAATEINKDETASAAPAGRALEEELARVKERCAEVSAELRALQQRKRGPAMSAELALALLLPLLLAAALYCVLPYLS